MRALKRAVLIIGQVFNLIMGDSFTVPASRVIEQYPYLRFDA